MLYGLFRTPRLVPVQRGQQAALCAWVSPAIVARPRSTNTRMYAKLGFRCLGYVDRGGVDLHARVSPNDAGFYTCRMTFNLSGVLSEVTETIECGITGEKRGEPASDVAEGWWLERSLLVSRVEPGDFNLNFTCRALSHRGNAVGYFTLHPADPDLRLPIILLATSMTSFFVSVLLLYRVFKVELALLFRALFPFFYASTDGDGKLYDAYVVYPRDQGDTLSAAVEAFVLKTLPEVLEEHYGYRLFILGRDSLPGQAVADVVDETMNLCRRLLLLYTSSSLSRPDGTSWFEQQTGLRRALLDESLPVILLEMEQLSDLSILPESLRLLCDKQAALQAWKRRRRWACQRTVEDGEEIEISLSSFSVSARFWRKVRYHMPKPRVIKPRQETVAVKLGSKQVLNCKVFIGPGSCETAHVEPISPYWLMNNNIIESKPDEISVEEYCTTENSLEYHHSNLTIFRVQEEFFNVPFQCVILSSLGHDNGTVVLIPSGEKDLYVIIGVFTAFALSALLCYLFRVDLVLAYRSFSPCLKRQNDGKLYDAYVTYPQGVDHSVSFATTFALHVLPEVLENRFGYKLFISERDATPGTAVPDVISETVGKSRRLIIILTPEIFTNTSQNQVELSNKLSSECLSLNNNNTSATKHPNPFDSCQPNWGTYECQVGLYDALVKECLQVILVQVGGDVDEAWLPESLRYVKHTQGILKWKQNYKNKTSGRFWKQMRYRMPPVQKDRSGFMV
ncbi:Interleukin-1 receptor-like 2 [Bagarius yarrelli]|uniref:Interleukin-1 receptor-like 2 n=1 Tax=Bagarius yarrelli TaxID=175774 RepID=A0A556U4K5_BAGYA|nr:Interleukin-1 receptor-like 2 [Bagarius yarrelli]